VGVAGDPMIVNYSRCSVRQLNTGKGCRHVCLQGAGPVKIRALVVGLFVLCVYLFASCPPVLGEVINVKPAGSIQEALREAGNGDTVQVPSGLYRENLVISKGIYFKGVDTGGGRPIVDASGNGSAITLTAEGINLEGFMARNARGMRASGIKALSNNSTIKNNIIQDSDNGIFFINANGNVVEDNRAIDIAGSGIFLSYYSSFNLILGNELEKNQFGIFIIDSIGNSIIDNRIRNTTSTGLMCFYGSSENRIYSNLIANSSYFGIGINEASRNSVEENEITDNYFGILLNGSADANILKANKIFKNDIGILIQRSNGIQVIDNVLEDNRNDSLVLLSSERAMVKRNTAVGSKHGLSLGGCRHILIKDNVVDQIKSYGISLVASDDNKIEGNLASNCSKGLLLNSSKQNMIWKNAAKDNGCGISIYQSSDGNILEDNIVERNQMNGIGTGIDITYSQKNELTNNTASHNDAGVLVFGSRANIIKNNTLKYNINGAGFIKSSENIVMGNDIRYNEGPVFLQNVSHNNTFKENIIKGNKHKGLFIDQTSHDNLLYGNCFAENEDADAYDKGTNRWDNGVEGNHYGCFDEVLEGCSDSDSDGTCDSSYGIPGGLSIDHAPQVS
jgi:parallel beta-helix repeat protein